MRRSRNGLAVVAVVFAVAGASSAHAQAPCWKSVTTDWSTGRLRSDYPVACYQAALAHLPEDVRIYSSAEDDIRRAMLAAIPSQAARAASRPVVRRPSAALPGKPAAVAKTAQAVVADTGPKGGGRSLEPLLVVLAPALLVLWLAAAFTYRIRRGRSR